jgi:hypothetical protein
MNRQERRAAQAQKAVSEAASEAGKVLQQRQQETKEEPKSEKPERPEGWTPKLRNDPREEAMKELEEKARSREKETPPAYEPEPKVEEPKAEEPKAEEPAPEVTPLATAPPEPAAPKMVKVKVDGEESEVPESEVEDYGGLKAYQIAKAQENRLKKINEALAESKRTQALMAELLARQAPATPPAPQVSEKEFIQSKLDAIRFGSPEEGAAALLEVQSRGRVDENSVIQRALTNMKHESAHAEFQKEFADVLVTPELKQFASMLTQQEFSKYVANGQPNWNALGALDFQATYRTIGHKLRSVLGKSSQPASASVPSGNPSQPEKEARKAAAASVTSLPTASSRAAIPAEEKPETREQILANARKARGLIG